MAAIRIVKLLHVYMTTVQAGRHHPRASTNGMLEVSQCQQKGNFLVQNKIDSRFGLHRRR